MENSTNQTSLFKIIKIFTLIVAALAIISAFIFYPKGEEEKKDRVIAITQIIQHPSLDQIRQGIVDHLAEKGLHDGQEIKIVYENAQGNITTASQIAQKFVGLNPDVMIAISTPSAQTVQSVARGKKIPLVFSAVTDPVGANLVQDLTTPASYITGTVDLPPLQKQLETLNIIVPNLSTVGVIYNPGEINSVKQIERLEVIANKMGLQLVKSPAIKSSEVSSATMRLIGHVDAIYLPNDNAVVSAIDSIVRIAQSKGVPIMASEDQSTKRGALIGLSNNQYEVGRETGEIIFQILNGESPEKIPVQVIEKPKLTVNEEVSKRMGVDIASLGSLEKR